ncbi:MAG: hypothetical protein K0U78_12320 [Actinomycetia bacterium]|nr:hypothetical protein [Actinomycetes bacterium]
MEQVWHGNNVMSHSRHLLNHILNLFVFLKMSDDHIEDQIEHWLTNKPQELRMLHLLKHDTSKYFDIARSVGMPFSDRMALTKSGESKFEKTHIVIDFFLQQPDLDHTWMSFVKVMDDCELNELIDKIGQEIPTEQNDKPFPTLALPERSPDDFWLKCPKIDEMMDILKNRTSDKHFISVMFGFNLSEFRKLLDDPRFESEYDYVGAIANKWLNETCRPTWDLFHALAVYANEPSFVEKIQLFVTKKNAEPTTC